MDHRKIWQTALEQSAVDMNCRPEDFLCGETKITLSRPHPGVRKYLHLPFDCEMVSYGYNVVASVREDVKDAVAAYLALGPASHAFETPGLHVLDDLLRPFGLETGMMGECFLPDVDKVQALPCAYETKVLYAPDFQDLYRPEWGNALCEDRKQLDVLGVGAYDGETLVGLAACSADGEEMWQIGVDVLPAYRRQGIASALTSRLTLEILAREKVPFYSCAWCNVASARNAARCGFGPAWVQLSTRQIPPENK